jgi:energy-coupling factor transporter ATP-binding protein EcfA2
MAELKSRAHRVLARVQEIYRLAFDKHAEAREILQALGLGVGLAEQLALGYAAGTLSSLLSDDWQVRKAIEAMGVLSGERETLCGCVTVPVLDPQGRVEMLAGLSIAGAGPVVGCVAGGLWNAAALKLHAEIHFASDLPGSLRRFAAGERATVALVGKPTDAVRDLLALWKPAKIVAGDEKTAAILASWNLAAAPPAAPAVEGGLTLDLGARRYILQEIRREGRRLAVLLRAFPKGGAGARHFVDAANLYAAADRARLVRHLSALFGVEGAIIEEDLARLVGAAEEFARAPQGQSAVALSEEERRKALALLSDPALFDRILSDFEKLGVVGEAPNKLAGYLVAVSRKLSDPLSLLVVSRSAAGKSTLADAVSALVPPEDLVRFTRLTGQALFYQKGSGLSHKLLVVEEESGVSEAGYPLRVLQSARRLALSTAQGAHQVEGPVAVIVTGTRASLDEETRGRFMIVSADESPEQTEAILAAQRNAETLEARAASDARGRVASLHHNAQRLLRPLGVVNPLATELACESRRLSARREQARLLGFVRTVAFLRQFQKEPRRRGDFEYVEVDAEDVRLARELLGKLSIHALEDLSPPSRRLLAEIERLGSGPFTRRALRETLGWGNTQLWTCLRELVDFELVVRSPGGRGRLVQYERLSGCRRLSERPATTETSPGRPDGTV